MMMMKLAFWMSFCYGLAKGSSGHKIRFATSDDAILDIKYQLFGPQGSGEEKHPKFFEISMDSKHKGILIMHVPDEHITSRIGEEGFADPLTTNKLVFLRDASILIMEFKDTEIRDRYLRCFQMLQATSKDDKLREEFIRTGRFKMHRIKFEAHRGDDNKKDKILSIQLRHTQPHGEHPVNDMEDLVGLSTIPQKLQSIQLGMAEETNALHGSYELSDNGGNPCEIRFDTTDDFVRDCGANGLMLWNSESEITMWFENEKVRDMYMRFFNMLRAISRNESLRSKFSCNELFILQKNKEDTRFFYVNPRFAADSTCMALRQTKGFRKYKDYPFAVRKSALCKLDDVTKRCADTFEEIDRLYFRKKMDRTIFWPGNEKGNLDDARVVHNIPAKVALYNKIYRRCERLIELRMDTLHSPRGGRRAHRGAIIHREAYRALQAALSTQLDRTKRVAWETRTKSIKNPVYDYRWTGSQGTTLTIHVREGLLSDSENE